VLSPVLAPPPPLQASSETRCKGSLELVSTRRVAATAPRKLKFGEGTFEMPGGATVRVTLKVGRRAFAALSKRAPIAASALVTTSDAAGNTVTVRTPVRVVRKRSRWAR
jgi:hypothetical protein